MAVVASDFQEIKPQWQARLEHVLNEATRGKRKLLLFVCSISLVAVVLGLFPTKIEALGIGFDVKDRLTMVKLLGVVTLYSMFGFVLYAWADLQLLARIHRASSTGYINEFVKGRATRMETMNWALRWLFDFAFPLAYGGYTLYRISQVLTGAVPL